MLPRSDKVDPTALVLREAYIESYIKIAKISELLSASWEPVKECDEKLIIVFFEFAEWYDTSERRKQRQL